MGLEWRGFGVCLSQWQPLTSWEGRKPAGREPSDIARPVSAASESVFLRESETEREN